MRVLLRVCVCACARLAVSNIRNSLAEPGEPPVKFSFPPCSELSLHTPIVSLRSVSFSYPSSSSSDPSPSEPEPTAVPSRAEPRKQEEEEEEEKDAVLVVRTVRGAGERSEEKRPRGAGTQWRDLNLSIDMYP